MSDEFGEQTEQLAPERRDVPMHGGRGVFISTYGCQMNVNDSERIYTLLEMADFFPVTEPESAEVILINSCSVREKPVHKVRSEVGRYRQMKKARPELIIGVGGCVGQQEKEQILKEMPLVDFVFGTDTLDMLPSILQDRLWQNQRVFAEIKHRAPYQVTTLVRDPGVSTFVNVTKGCDNFCTFCIVPYTRGRERSRTLEEVVADINSLAERSVKEVTLLGQNVNSYRSGCGADFADLLAAVVQRTPIDRIRFTTSHPKDFDEKLATIMAQHGERICEYIHLPFQSGSSEVLQRMNRGYTRQDYLDRIAMIRRRLPQAVFSADAIVGFPGESEAQFQETLSLLEEVGFETLFAFKYSPRPFTKAARFDDQIDEEVKAQRLERLLMAQDNIAYKIAKTYENRVVRVLVEKVDGRLGHLVGRSTQNKLVYFPGSRNLIGRTVEVLIKEAHPSTLKGLLNDSSSR